MIKYNFEVTEFSKEAASKLANARVAGISCLLGIKVSCWGQQAGLSAVTFFATLVGGWVGALADAIVWSKIVQNGLTSAATSFIKGMVSSYATSTCGCGTSLPQCTTPTAMRLIIGDCGDEHLWQIVGGGTSPSYFSYTVQNGVFPEFNNSVNIGQTMNKTVSVKQINMSQNVIVTCVVHCTNGYQYAKSNSFNVNAVKNGVSNIVFTGVTYVPVGDTERYHVYGTSQASNGKLYYTFDRNFAGQIVATGPDYVDIKWNVAMSNYPYATAYCTVHNSCSGAQGMHQVLVTTY